MVGTETKDCWACGGSGYLEGTCTCWDDCCCCLEPEEEQCMECGGKGYFEVKNGTLQNKIRRS